MGFGRTVGERSLRPVRWRGRPGAGPLLRAGLVATLLGLAATVLYAPPGCGPAPGAAPAGTASAPAGPAPASSAPTGPPPAAADGGAGDRAGGALPLPGGTVGVPVRLAEPAALAVVRPGSRVDLLALPAAGPATTVLLASRALVLDVVGAGDLDGSSALYLALAPPQAERVVGQPEGSRFAVIVRG
ncbi:flagellar biosynthesis protein FlgA [Micromonospora sp. NPDC050187]|uniref:flagellar biosynthesis protein FlgA n=1 Tax=Micromonospora sp. NPDC050187 TaxID=3364277 RepID=UPI0037BBF64D